MADLQRHVNATPSIASVGSPSAQGTDYSSAILGIGDAVKSFVADKKKSALDEELATLGDEVFAATTGKAVKNSTARMDRLKLKQEQGLLTQTMVNIEAEKILKESIGVLPAFAPELRRHAASQLGFDPTGSYLQSLLTVPKQQKGSGNAVYDKFRENAIAINATTGADIEDVMKLQGQALYKSQQADLIAQQASLGNAGRKEILSASLAEADGHISDFVSSLVQRVNGGGITNPAEVTAELEAKVLGHKQMIRDRYRSAGIFPDPADLAKDMAGVEDAWSAVQSIVKSGNAAEIFATNAKALSNAMTVESYNVMGDVALYNTAGGQEAVKNFFLLRNKYTERGQLDLLKANNPVLARYADADGDLTNLASEAYKKVMGVDPQFSQDNDPQVRPELDAMADQVLYDVTRSSNTTGDERRAALNHARAHGKRFKALGAYFQSGVRAKATPEEVKFVKQVIQEEVPSLTDRIAAEVLAAGEFKVRVVNGQLQTYDAKKDHKTGYMGGTSSTAVLPMLNVPMSGTVTGDIKRLNAVQKGLSNGWSQDTGYNAESFLHEVAAKINGEVDKIKQVEGDLGAAIDAWENNPTPENWDIIRQLNPELVADVERGSRANTQEGGDNAQ